MYLLEMFGISLLLTWGIELPLAWLMGLRERSAMALVLLVNILTNPVAVLLCWLGMPQLSVELGVFAVEAAVYCWFARENGWKISHPVRLAAVCNAVSWLLGFLIQRIGG